MWTILFFILLFVVFGKLLVFAIRATWSIAKICFIIGLLPVILVALVLSGLIALALPILVVIGIVSLIAKGD